MILYSSCNSKLNFMSENATQPEGKGLAIGGFILSLVGLVLLSVITGIALVMVAAGGSAWLMYLWTVLCIASIVMSAMAMGKLKKTGGKRGLAIAGLVIGIVATVWSIFATLGLQVVDSGVDSATGDLQELNDALNDLENAR